MGVFFCFIFFPQPGWFRVLPWTHFPLFCTSCYDLNLAWCPISALHCGDAGSFGISGTDTKGWLACLLCKGWELLKKRGNFTSFVMPGMLEAAVLYEPLHIECCAGLPSLVRFSSFMVFHVIIVFFKVCAVLNVLDGVPGFTGNIMLLCISIGTSLYKQ